MSLLRGLMRYRALLLLITIGGCSVGQVDGLAADDGADPEDIESFNTIMSPIVSRCAGSSCHGGVQAPNLTGFVALQPQYKVQPATTNKLITKKQEAGIVAAGNMHQGVMYFSATEETMVSGWIDSIGTP
jgi:hypothetical protein